jgi:hypothetical protein
MCAAMRGVVRKVAQFERYAMPLVAALTPGASNRYSE